MNMIEVENVTMKFRLANDKIQSLKEYFIAVATKKLKYKELCVFSDLNFEIKKGEVVGIIGRNGAGKSTLLKIISGVLSPTKGSVKSYGNIVPMLELGSGFDIELSGRENIFLNGSILGYSKKFLEEKYDEILEFSELGDFIEEPIRNYSSGMLMRLAFSIATIVHPEILIVDEILAVGDEAFQRKSKRKMLELMGGGTTVLFVSHSIDQIKEMCNRVIWIENGIIEKDGEAKEVCDAYQKFLNPDFYEEQKTNLRNTDAYKYLMDVLIVYHEDELSYYTALARKEQLLAGNTCAQELCELDLEMEAIKQYRVFIFINCDYYKMEIFVKAIKALNKSYIIEYSDEFLLKAWKTEDATVFAFSDIKASERENDTDNIPIAVTERVLQVAEWMRYDKNILPYKNVLDIESEQELINYNRAVLEKKRHISDGIRLGVLVDNKKNVDELTDVIQKEFPYVVRTIITDMPENVVRDISKVDYVINMAEDKRWDYFVSMLCKLVGVTYCGKYKPGVVTSLKIEDKKEEIADYKEHEKEIEIYSTLISGQTFTRIVKERMSQSITIMVKQISDLKGHPELLDKIADSAKDGYDISILAAIKNEDFFEYKGIKIPIVNKSTKYILGGFDMVIVIGADEQPFIITYPNIKKRIYFVPDWEPEKYGCGDFARIKINQSYQPCIPVEFWTDSRTVQVWLKENYEQDALLLD